MFELPVAFDKLIALAAETGESILDIYYRSNQFRVTAKADASPLTQADLVAHAKIVAGLAPLTPDIPILSEEQAAISFEERQKWHDYWLIDPLDGTKEFISHSGDFAINIAYIKNHCAVFGLIYSPVLQKYYFASKGKGAFRQKLSELPERIKVRSISNEKMIVAVGHHYKIVKLQKVLADIRDYEIITMGSSLKFCAIAEGNADFYPRLGDTSEWDTAAGQIIVEEAGGTVVDFNFQPLQYNMKESLLNPQFLAMGDSQYLIEKLKILF